jgi:hypothetical protein
MFALQKDFMPESAVPQSFPTPASLWLRLSAWCRGMLLRQPGDGAALDFPFAASEVTAYGTHTGGADAGAPDAQTWDDLMLTPYLAQLTPGTSIFGQQALDRRLRHGAVATTATIARVQALLAEPAQRALLQTGCRPLREADTEISAALFGAAPPPAPWWSARLSLVPLALLLTVGLAGALSALTTGLAWIAWLVAGALWLLLLALQSQFRDEAERWQRSVKTVQLLLTSYGGVAALKLPLLAQWGAERAHAGKVARALWQSVLPRTVVVADYADYVMLSNIKHYFHTRAVVRREAAFLRGVFDAVAELEADLALARHLREAPAWCWAQRSVDPRQLALDGMVHPLLAGAAPLSLTLAGQGAFLSGQNGIGKSTLLRSVGLNLVVARAFGFCYARGATVPVLAVYASMQSEDSLDGGESLYLAELRRAKELLALAERPQPALFLIDEIFRGTNHLESISAAAAVLHTLADGGLVMVSSHNLVLAPLLVRSLAPWCVSLSADGALQLAPGVLAQTNGLALLAARGFGADIEARAGRVFDWLNSYLAHPPVHPDVL